MRDIYIILDREGDLVGATLDKDAAIKIQSWVSGSYAETALIESGEDITLGTVLEIRPDVDGGRRERDVRLAWGRGDGPPPVEEFQTGGGRRMVRGTDYPLVREVFANGA